MAPRAPGGPIQTVDIGWKNTYGIASSACSFDGHVATRTSFSASTHPRSGDGWTSMGDLIRNGILPFRCRVHRLDYTALLQCIPQQIKLNTRDYSVLWNTLDRDQCDLFFKFNLKRRRFEASYEKYSNALSQNRSESVLMKCDRYERKNNSTFLWSLCGVFVKSKALCSLGFAIKAVITFSNKLFKWIQKL